MRDRTRRMERLLEVQQAMHRLEEWRLAALDRERHAIGEAEAELVGRLGGDDPFLRLFADLASRHLRSLAVTTGRLARDREVQSARTFAAALAAKRTERFAERSIREERREGEKRRLQSVIEAFGASAADGDASLP
jgi:hypothetical protein